MSIGSVSSQSVSVQGLGSQFLLAPALVSAPIMTISFREMLISYGVPAELVSLLDQLPFLKGFDPAQYDAIVEIVDSWSFNEQRTMEVLTGNSTVKGVLDNLPIYKEMAGKRRVRDDVITGRYESAIGTFPCPKCHGRNTGYSMIKTGGSDEPQTAFISCYTCNKTFKMRW